MSASTYGEHIPANWLDDISACPAPPTAGRTVGRAVLRLPCRWAARLSIPKPLGLCACPASLPSLNVIVSPLEPNGHGTSRKFAHVHRQLLAVPGKTCPLTELLRGPDDGQKRHRLFGHPGDGGRCDLWTVPLAYGAKASPSRIVALIRLRQPRSRDRSHGPSGRNPPPFCRIRRGGSVGVIARPGSFLGGIRYGRSFAPPICFSATACDALKHPVVGPPGLEPGTSRLKVACSTD